jgi:uncharacterized membrane protein YkgB
MAAHLRARMERAERQFGEWSSVHGVQMLRVTLGFVFVWFGVLKFCPGLCDVEVLAGKTVQLLTLGLIPIKICVAMLGVLECGIGAMLMVGRAMRATVICLLLHLSGTFLPMVLYPGETWKHFPYAPTLVGQYILKNLILMSAAVVVGTSAFSRSSVLTLVPMPKRRAVSRPTIHRTIGVN